MMRNASLPAGLVIITAAWAGLIDSVGVGPFSAHMTAHIAVVALAAPLLAAGAAGRALDPVRSAPRLFAPIPAAIVELVVVWGWHVPALHDAARSYAPAYAAEQASFLIAGLLLWLSAFGGVAARETARAAAGVVAMLFTSMHMTLLGALFALTPRPLYSHGVEHTLPTLADQHLGGVIMLLVGGGSYLAGGLWLTGRVLRHRSITAPAGART
jgi:putative membrane protein